MFSDTLVAQVLNQNGAGVTGVPIEFILNDDGEEGRMIIYRSNRALLFDSNICHYACAPSRFFNGLRISLAYKLWN